MDGPDGLPGRVCGVDFSGSVQGGRKIWVAAGVIEGGGLRVQMCVRAMDLPDGGVERERALAALRRFIAGQGACAVGLDFPFGLAQGLVPDATWEDFVGAFAVRYPTAETFRACCNEAAGGRELRRLTDCEARTPFCPYNIRLYRQTYHGIRNVLALLVAEDTVRVLPMQPPAAGVPWLLEICPASRLKALGLYQPPYTPYKGGKPAHREARERIVQELAQPMVIPPGIRDAAVADTEGDAIDSLIAAWATAEALRGPLVSEGEGRQRYLIEGYVYVGRMKDEG